MREHNRVAYVKLHNISINKTDTLLVPRDSMRTPWGRRGEIFIHVDFEFRLGSVRYRFRYQTKSKSNNTTLYELYLYADIRLPKK